MKDFRARRWQQEDRNPMMLSLIHISEQGIRFVRANILGSKDGITTHSCQYITIRGADVY